MAEAKPQFLSVGGGVDARQIAYIADAGAPGGTPGVMWLSGLKSEMTSTKASVIAAWAAEHGLPCTRFDYSGHGQSPGRFEDGTIGAWLAEALAVFREVTTGPQILIGSSMGGYIALLLLRALMRDHPQDAERITALLLIAPAWDMTERLMWARFPEATRREIMETGVYLRPSKYGDGDYAISRRLIEDGRNHLIGDAPFDPGRPIHVLHGHARSRRAVGAHARSRRASFRRSRARHSGARRRASAVAARGSRADDPRARRPRGNRPRGVSYQRPRVGAMAERGSSRGPLSAVTPNRSTGRRAATDSGITHIV